MSGGRRRGDCERRCWDSEHMLHRFGHLLSAFELIGILLDDRIRASKGFGQHHHAGLAPLATLQRDRDLGVDVAPEQLGGRRAVIATEECSKFAAESSLLSTDSDHLVCEQQRDGCIHREIVTATSISLLNIKSNDL
eukprot:6221181-Prymnesium_polylepis.2